MEESKGERGEAEGRKEEQTSEGVARRDRATACLRQ